MKNWPPSPLLLLFLFLLLPFPVLPYPKDALATLFTGRKEIRQFLLLNKLRHMSTIHIFSKKMKIKIKSLKFVKNCAPCGRLFASPAEEGGREGGTLLADGLSPLLLLLLLFLPLFLPSAHTQLLYIQPSSLQPRGFHDRKRAPSLSPLSSNWHSPRAAHPTFPLFRFTRISHIFCLFYSFFRQVQACLVFFPFVSPPICVRGYHRNVFLSRGERGVILFGGPTRGPFRAPGASLHPLQNDRRVCALYFPPYLLLRPRDDYFLGTAKCNVFQGRHLKEEIGKSVWILLFDTYFTLSATYAFGPGKDPGPIQPFFPP